MTLLQACLLAVLQGASELFPVSSLGHAVILPALLGWKLDQNSPFFLPFLVMLHLGTAVALLGYFWRDWVGLARGILGLTDPTDAARSRHLLLLMALATIPAAILGKLFEHRLRDLFGSPSLVALVLIANGVLLAVCERLRSRPAGQQAARIPLHGMGGGDALIIGLWQCLALIPGLSRSGATIAGGLLRGVDHQGAAHFSFLIATPIILGAAVLEVPKLLHHGAAPGIWRLSLIAATLAGVVAWLSTALLMRWFRRDDRAGLDPFAGYCVVAGLAAFLLLRWH